MSRLQLYSLATPNGQKASIALEEMGLDYEAHTVNIMDGVQFEDWYVKINPNSKIPALVDPDYNGGLAIMESGAILLHLAEKAQKFIPMDAILRSECLQWLFFQVGSIGPMFGQFGHFYKYAKDKCDHTYPVERYTKETKRLLKVLDKRLADNDYLVANEVTIADFATAPWVMCLDRFYKASETLELESFNNINRWLKALNQRPAFQKGLEICPL